MINNATEGMTTMATAAKTKINAKAKLHIVNSSNTICFCNAGTLDKRAFTMMGLSAKPDSETAIGFFGTGFKYAIATLLRLNHEVRIVSRSNGKPTEYTFDLIGDKFRDKDITCIRCTTSDGDMFELPFTTHLGINWKAWQAYRELYTNVKDENGDVHLVCDEASMYDHSSNDGVQVIVTGRDIVGIYNEHDKYFLSAPTVATGYRMRAVSKRAEHDNVVYYKTMYTGTKLEKPTYFTYDYVKTVELTEDRTLADTWYIRHHIAEIWLAHMDYDQLVEYLPKIANQDYYEYGIEIGYIDVSEDFHKACAYLTKYNRPMPMWARDAYTKKLPFDQQVDVYTPTRHERVMLKRALAVLRQHKHCIDDAADKLILCASLPNDILGYYKLGIIYIAKAAFDRGFEKLLGTLYEEHLHMIEGCEDMSREMQNILVDKCANLMLQVYEMEQEETSVE